MFVNENTPIDLQGIAASCGFVDCGAAEAKPLSGADRERFVRYLSKGCNASMEYLERNFDKRMDPSELVPGARSVLCFLAPYGSRGGRVASFAHGKDYHKVVKDRLHAVAARLREIVPDFEGRVFTDSAPVAERFWAERAGLGFIGLNNFLISPRFGLRTIIGVIICNVPSDRFAPHPPLEATDCGACGRCIDSCPNGALNDDGEGDHWLDARRCISFHTIESQTLYDVHPIDYRGSIFGCERCIENCPWDRECPSLEEFETNAATIASMGDDDWRNMSEEEFKRTFGDTGLSRAGLEKIKNNL